MPINPTTTRSWLFVHAAVRPRAGAAPRAAKSQAMARFARRRLRVVLITAVLLAVLVPLGLVLRDSSLVRVEHVTVSGIEGPQADAVRARLTAAAQDMTTLHVREDELKAAARAYPVVHSVSAQADLPHTLRIAVNAYEPVAVLQAGAQGIAVASDGTLLRGNPTDDLAVIALRTIPGGDRLRHPDPVRAVRLMAAAPAALRARVERMVISGRNLIAVLREGPKLYFGDGARRMAKWSAAARVLADSASRGASYVDLRLPERPVAGGLASTESEDPTPKAR